MPDDAWVEPADRIQIEGTEPYSGVKLGGESLHWDLAELPEEEYEMDPDPAWRPLFFPWFFPRLRARAPRRSIASTTAGTRHGLQVYRQGTFERHRTTTETTTVHERGNWRQWE